MHPGAKTLTADGLVDSTKDTRVYNLIVKAKGSDATIIFKLVGASGTELTRIVCAANTTTQQAFEGGMLFAGGCYVDLDGNTDYVTVIYKREG